MTIPLSIEYVRKFVKENSKSTLISNEYKSNRTKMKFICACGKEFEARFDNFTKQNGSRMCKECRPRSELRWVALSQKEVSEFVQNNSECVYLDGYKTAHTNMKLKCRCENIFETTMINFKNGKRKCKVCTNRIPHNKSCEEDIRKVISVESSCTYLRGYTTSAQPFEIVCACGIAFPVLLSNFRAGKKRCDSCSNKISNGESMIESWLKANNIEYEFQKRFKGCKDKRTLPFDFYLPKHNIIIEFDGEQHYREHSFFQKRAGLENTKRRDEIKNNYCKQNSIKMIRISYRKIQEVEDLLNRHVNTEVSV